VNRTVSLDRQRIERTDFPVRFRGYDRAAVDAHLRALADELERRAGGLADAASEQVRAVLAAAEASAAEIVRSAEREAERTRDVAGRAGEEAAGRAVAAAGDALTRIEALRADLRALIGALRPQGAEAAIAEAPQPPPTPDDADELMPDPDAPGVAAPPGDSDRPVPDPDAPEVPADPDTEAGARLVALEMALGGAGRAEVDRYLAEHFAVPDRAALLDDVYAAAGA
jgi:DivIVA domain-containing protein